MPMHITMVDPQGRECFAGSAIEVNDLLAAGYTIKGHTSPLQRTDEEAEQIAQYGDGGAIA